MKKLFTGILLITLTVLISNVGYAVSHIPTHQKAPPSFVPDNDIQAMLVYPLKEFVATKTYYDLAPAPPLWFAWSMGKVTKPFKNYKYLNIQRFNC